MEAFKQHKGQWRANCCFLRLCRPKKGSEIQSDTLTLQQRNPKLREIKDLPKSSRQVHEQVRAVCESSDGLHCAVLTF